MPNPTEEFFEQLASRGHVPWLEHERGALRYEVVEGQYIRPWTVTFDDGEVKVSSEADSEVDAILRADRDLFDRAACGEANLVSAWLRGEVDYSGSLELLTQIGRLLPGPSGQRGHRTARDGKGRTG